MNQSVFKLRASLILAGITIVFWLFYMGSSPLGRAAYEFDCHDYEFLSRPSPVERVSIEDDCDISLIGNPVYFNLRTLRPFQKASFVVKFERIGTPGILEMGLLTDKSLWRYDLEPISNPYLDELPWTKNMYGKVSFYHKDNEFADIADLKERLGNYSRLATYNYDFGNNLKLDDAQAGTTTVIQEPLRGNHSSFVYHKGGDLSLKFDISDLNRNKDREDFSISVFHNGAKVAEKRVVDEDMAKEGSGMQSPAARIDFAMAKMPAGTYKIDFNSNDDIVTERYEAGTGKLVFPGLLRLQRREGKAPLLLHGNGNLFQATTMMPASLGAIMIASSTLELKETYKQYQLSIDKDFSSIARIAIPMSDVMISSNGLLSFSAASFFDPMPKKVDNSFKGAYFNHIVADYAPPRPLGGRIYEQRVDFDLSKGYSEDGLYSLMFSAPGLEEGDGIVIKDMVVRLEGRNIFQKALDTLKHAL